MALTRAFKETVQARISKDRKYRKELLREGVECVQEPHAHAGPPGEPAGTQPVRGDRPAPEERRPAVELSLRAAS